MSTPRNTRPTPKPQSPKPAQDLGTLADQLYAQRSDRLALSRRVDEMKKAEAELQVAIVQMLATAHLTRASGADATVSATVASVAQVEDWAAFEGWVLRKSDLAVLGRKLSQKHVNELREAGQAPDGLAFVSVNKLSVTKA